MNKTHKAAMTLALMGLCAIGVQAQTGSGSSGSSGSSSSSSRQSSGQSTYGGSSGMSQTPGSSGNYGGASSGSSSRTSTADEGNYGGSSSGTAGTSQLSSSERQFVEEAAKGGLAEVELGQLAEQKAESQSVKDFGKRMVADHGKANDELKSHMKNWGMTAPTSLDSKHQAEKDKLSKLSGAEFDREYMNTMVKDHQKDVADFKKESTSASNADLKAFAAKTLPTLQEHLQLAEQVHGEVNGASKSSSTSSTSKSSKSSNSSSSSSSGSGR